ncbi:hypothetical protein [Acrocarpospora sp. B8E8]|uniref:hypothetical protein n=1 Tax=Acrocarpospora sp. B8E8 TaxID=3153572 RepID=UPI00325C815D
MSIRISAERRPLVGAVVEIVENRGASSDEIVVPNEIRLNGVSLLAPADSPVTVHEVGIKAGEPVAVTLTLFARRLIVGTEADIAAQPPIYGRGHFFAEANDQNPDFPVTIQRRLSVDDPGGVAVEHHGIDVEQAERLIAELQVAIAHARKADADA